MTARSWRPAMLLLALLVPVGARAQDGLDGRFSIAAQVGMQSELSGDLAKGATGLLIGKPTTLEPVRYKDVYAPDLRLQGFVGYGVGERTEIILRGSYYKADATTVEVGAFEDKPVYAFFDPYEEVGVELGLRWYISAAGRLKSYVAPVVGARFLSEVLLSYSIPDAGSAVLNVPFTEKCTVPVVGLDLGFTFDLGSRVFVGIDSGLRWQPAATPFDALPGFAGIDDGDSRWTAPVAASLGVRF